jgi:hypothetical protein
VSGHFKGPDQSAKRTQGRGCALRHLFCAVAIAAVLGNISLAFPKRNTANQNSPVIACDNMTKEDRVEVAAAGALGVLLAVAAPKFSREVNIGLWLAYLAFVYGLAVVKLRRKRWSRMTLAWVLVIGWGLASAASLVAWYGFPPDEKASSHRLDLYYMAGGRGNVFTANPNRPDEAEALVHISNAEFVNRSDKNMSLSFLLMVKFPIKDGSYYVTSASGEWKENLTDKGTTSILNVPRESTAKGHLIFRMTPIWMLKQMHSDKDFGVDTWEEVKEQQMALRIENKVSGEFVLSESMHYPNRSEWPDEWKKGLQIAK